MNNRAKVQVMRAHAQCVVNRLDDALDKGMLDPQGLGILRHALRALMSGHSDLEVGPVVRVFEDDLTSIGK